MNAAQIDRMIKSGRFLSEYGIAELVETHISWVVLASEFVFKIKKPVQFSFLDFSTLNKRKYYCEKELELNQRLAKSMYLEVVPVKISGENIFIENGEGEMIDFAVKMRRMDQYRQMDLLLLKDEVKESDVIRVADQLAKFHKKALKIDAPLSVDSLHEDFIDILKIEQFVKKELGNDLAKVIRDSVDFSAFILNKLKWRLLERQALGFFIDGHGDLHSRNIFLLENESVIFDCIEFNDHLRQVDVLDELAFFCMDLNYHDAQDLERVFLENYSARNNCFLIDADKQLYDYFKLYRANVRAKVTAINAMQLIGKPGFEKQLQSTNKYLLLMDKYLAEMKCCA